jgi:hypothetical protein
VGIKKELVNQAKGDVETWTPENEEKLLEEKMDYDSQMIQDESKGISSLFSKKKDDIPSENSI